MSAVRYSTEQLLLIFCLRYNTSQNWIWLSISVKLLGLSVCQEYDPVTQIRCLCWCWPQSTGEVWALCSESWWTRENTYIALGSAASLGILRIVHWVSTSHLSEDGLKKTGRGFTQQCLIWKETSSVVRLIPFVAKQVFDNKQNNRVRWTIGNNVLLI